MEKLYVGKVSKNSEIPSKIIEKYGIKRGDISPFTRLKIISENDDKPVLIDITDEIQNDKPDLIDITDENVKPVLIDITDE